MPTSEPPPELEDQFESLLHVIWDSERRERQMDRIESSLKADEEKRKRKVKRDKAK